MIQVSVSMHVRRQDDRAQRRRDRECREQAAGQRIGIGPRHRPEDVAFDAAQGEQRQERRDDDGGGKEDRPRHVGGGREDGMALHAHGGVVGDMALLGFRKRGGLRQPAEDRLHHDHGGVHDQPEIDGADRQQVGGFAAQHQNDDGEKQREGNGGADDQRASEIAEENPLQQHDQENADHHVVQHGRGRDVDQILAVVDALDVHAGRQDAGIVDRCHQLLRRAGWSASFARRGASARCPARCRRPDRGRRCRAAVSRRRSRWRYP